VPFSRPAAPAAKSLVTGGFYEYLKQTVEINRSLRIKLRDIPLDGMILISGIEQGTYPPRRFC
jgi:hypothetical protein